MGKKSCSLHSHSRALHLIVSCFQVFCTQQASMRHGDIFSTVLFVAVVELWTCQASKHMSYNHRLFFLQVANPAPTQHPLHAGRRHLQLWAAELRVPKLHLPTGLNGASPALFYFAVCFIKGPSQERMCLSKMLIHSLTKTKLSKLIKLDHA